MPLNLLLDILIEFMNMILSFFFYHLLNIKSVYFQLIGHENNIGCDKSASNPDAEPLAMDLPSAVNDLSQLLLSTATEVATSIAPTRPKRTSLASGLAKPLRDRCLARGGNGLDARSERNLLSLGMRRRHRATGDGCAVRLPHRHFLLLPVLHAPRRRGSHAPLLVLVPGLLQRCGRGAWQTHLPQLQFRRT